MFISRYQRGKKHLSDLDRGVAACQMCEVQCFVSRVSLGNFLAQPSLAFKQSGVKNNDRNGLFLREVKAD